MGDKSAQEPYEIEFSSKRAEAVYKDACTNAAWAYMQIKERAESLSGLDRFSALAVADRTFAELLTVAAETATRVDLSAGLNAGQLAALMVKLEEK